MRGPAQFHRVVPLTGPECRIWIDDEQVVAKAGQSVLSILLETGGFVRRHESGGEPRAGFCLMGACQDCWVWLSPSQRGRACTARVEPEMRIFTMSPPLAQAQP